MYKTLAVMLVVFALIGCDPKDDVDAVRAPVIGDPCKVLGLELMSQDGVLLVCDADRHWRRKFFEEGSR